MRNDWLANDRHRTRAVGAISLVLLVSWVACREQEPPPPAPPPPPPLPTLVSVGEVRARLDAHGSVQLIDSRPDTDFRTERIDGSWGLPVEMVPLDPGAELAAPTRARVSALLGAAGVRQAGDIVVIDRSDAAGFGRAAFVCWIVALTGYERCSVMTGGIEAWRAAGFGLTSGPLTARPQPGDLAPIPPDPAALAPLTLVRAATTNAEPALIDVRSLGAGPGIPGSTQLPLEALLLPGGEGERSRLDTKATRAGLFGEHGMIVLGEGRYDGALGWFVLARTLGLRDVRLYPEGLAGWRQVPEVPGGAAASPAPQQQSTTGAH